MPDIIDIAAEREKRKPPQPETPWHGPWIANVDIFAPADGSNAYNAKIRSFDDRDGLTPAARLRLYAKACQSLALTLLDIAHEIEPDGDGRLMGTAMIFESSRVVTWTSHGIATATQLEWLRDRYADAASVLKLPEASKS